MFAKMLFRPEANKNVDFFLKCATAAYAIAYLTWPDDDDMTPAPNVKVEFKPHGMPMKAGQIVLPTIFGAFHLSNLGTDKIQDALWKFNVITKGMDFSRCFEMAEDKTAAPLDTEKLMLMANHQARKLVYSTATENTSIRAKL